MTAPEIRMADCGMRVTKSHEVCPDSLRPPNGLAREGETRGEMKRRNNSRMTVAKVHSLTRPLKRSGKGGERLRPRLSCARVWTVRVKAKAIHPSVHPFVMIEARREAKPPLSCLPASSGQWSRESGTDKRYMAISNG